MTRRRNVITITIDLDQLAQVFKAVTEAVKEAVRAFTDFFEAAVEPSLRRFAIERMGITEVDIKRVDGTTIVTWNRRRLPVDLEAFREWVAS